MATRATAKHPIKRFGLTEIYATTDTQIDVVFVHGLHGHPQHTWSSISSHTIWPASLLGPMLQQEKVRILVYGYAAQVASFIDGASGDKIHNHAEQLVAELAANRSTRKATEHPIIFVAHSLGGLIVKRALIHSSEITSTKTEHLRSIFVSTIGILFFGTPHRGLNATTWRLRLEAICQAALPKDFTSDDSQLINESRSNNETLQTIDRQFTQLSRSLHMFFFHEGKPTDLGGGRWEYIVDEESASPTIQDVERAVIQKDHMQICKFENSREPGFDIVTEAIHRYASAAARIIGPRWESEKADRVVKREAEAKELVGTKTSSRANTRPDSILLENPIFSVKFPQDGNFVNREKIFIEIVRQMEASYRVALYGWGGVGKSQIAIEYAYRFRQSRPESHIFWVYAANDTVFEQAYTDIARRLKLPGCEDPKIDVCKLVTRWLDEEADGTWLMILDNTDNAEVIFPSPDAGLLSAKFDESSMNIPSSRTPLIEYLPTQLSDKKRLLITTRDKFIGEQLVVDENCIEVPSMSLHEASICLQSKLEPSTRNYDKASSEKLVDVLACNPLAITQAAAFMRRNQVSTKEYLEALEKDRQNLTDFLSYELQDPRRQRGYPSSVFRTWRISFEYITRIEPETARLLSLAAMLSPQRISAKILRQSVEKDLDFWTAMGTLRGYQLITNELDTEIFTMHPLVQASLQHWLEQKHQKAIYTSKALKLLAEEFPDGEYENREICELLFAHVQIVLGYKCNPEDQRYRAALLHNLGWFESTQGNYDAAYQAASEAYNIRQSSNESDIMATDSLSLLASILYGQGKYNVAEEINRRVLQREEKTLGVEHPKTLISLGNLATVLKAQGKYEVAEKMNRQVLQGREKVLGVEHPETLISFGNLATVLQRQGKYEAAEEMNRRTLQGFKKVLGVEHPETLMSLSNLATVLEAQGKYEAAEEINRRALQGREKVLGISHPGTLTSLSNLATVLKAQGKYEAAEEMNRRALQGKEKVLGVEHPETLISFDNLATVLKAQGKYEAAEEMGRRVLRGGEKGLGVEHPETLISLNNLAVVLGYQSKYEAAEEMHRRALQGFKKVLGIEHPSTLICSNNLASLSSKWRKYKEAERLNRREL